MVDIWQAYDSDTPEGQEFVTLEDYNALRARVPDHTEAFRVRLVAVEELIAEAQQDKSAFDGEAGRGSGVNWADLRAVDVEHWVRDDGDSGYRVYVEEVSPTAEKLPAFLQAGLADRGIENTAIVCKW